VKVAIRYLANRRSASGIAESPPVSVEELLCGVLPFECRTEVVREPLWWPSACVFATVVVEEERECHGLLSGERERERER
jgi:hypothetical protein